MLMMAGLAERSLDRAIKGLLQRDDDLCAICSWRRGVMLGGLPWRLSSPSWWDWPSCSLRTGIFPARRPTPPVSSNEPPVASDLRRVVAAMKLSPNIERIADQATNIARRARKLNKHPALPEVEMITPIQAHAMAMFKDAIDAFVREDVDLGRAVVARDKDLDYMNKMANRQLTERMAQDPKQLRGYLNLIFISRCLERVGDHATNIAEDAVYAAAAEDIRHQPASAAG